MQDGALRVQGMAFAWLLNPYMGCADHCTFCYVRGFEQRADRPSGETYGCFVRVKTNVVAVLDAEVRRRSWKHKGVAIGSATDPYQPAEGQYRFTRGCIQVLARSRTPFDIITRGPLIVRDIDVLAEASTRVEVSVDLSVPTLGDHVWRNTEPGTAPPRQRLRAVRMLVDACIRAGVGMAPVLPGLSDRPEQLLEVVRAARDAGATHLWTRTLYLQSGTREHFLECLARGGGALRLALSRCEPRPLRGSADPRAREAPRGGGGHRGPSCPADRSTAARAPDRTAVGTGRGSLEGCAKRTKISCRLRLLFSSQRVFSFPAGRHAGPPNE